MSRKSIRTSMQTTAIHKQCVRFLNTPLVTRLTLLISERSMTQLMSPSMPNYELPHAQIIMYLTTVDANLEIIFR